MIHSTLDELDGDPVFLMPTTMPPQSVVYGCKILAIVIALDVAALGFILFGKEKFSGGS